MRIGIDARPLTQPTTGIGRYTLEIISRLSRSDLELCLYSHQPFNVPDVPVHVIRHGNLSLSALASLFAQYRFPRWAYQDQVDIFWSPRHHLPLFSSAPSVLTIHDLVWRKAPQSMIQLGRLIEILLMPPSLRKAQAIIAVSEATRDDLIEYQPGIGNRIKVIPEAPFSVDSAHQAGAIRGDYMLFVGTFEPRKNISGILHAFRQLLADGMTSHRLVLAGNPGWKSDIAGQLNELGLTDRVTLAGQVSQTQLEALYRGCDFVVQPSHYEGFGLTVLEAMTFGKPVITSNISSLPEVAGDAALLVDPNSTNDIAEAMRKLITDEELYSTLAGRTQAQAGRFSWDQAAMDTLAVFDRVAASADSR